MKYLNEINTRKCAEILGKASTIFIVIGRNNKVKVHQYTPEEQRGLLSTLYKNNTGSRVCFANFVYFVRRENFRRILRLFSAVIHWFSRVKENFWFGVID